MFLKRISSKIIAVFVLLLIGLASTVISGLLATDTQEQHIILSDILNNLRYYVSRVVDQTAGHSELCLADKEKYRKKARESMMGISDHIKEVDHRLNALLVKRYIYNKREVPLKFSDDLVVDFDFHLKKAIKNWEKLKKLTHYLLTADDNVKSEFYVTELERFRMTNTQLLENSAEVMRICREDAEDRKSISDTVHVMSIILALSVFLFLIYHITVNFYTPLREIRSIFHNMSRGTIKQTFKRDKKDEFADLYNNFNNFIDNLNTIFSLEDRIILEEKLEQMLIYIHSNFKSFIPFETLGIKYRFVHNHILSTILEEDGSIKTAHNGDDLEEFEKITVSKDRLISPIIINNTYMGYIFFTFSNSGIDKSYINFLELFKDKLSMAFYKGILLKSLLSIVTESLAEMAEAKDPETGLHLVRMSNYSAIIAGKLMEKGMYKETIDNRYIEDLRVSAPMHDIGKVATPDRILLKPGKLDNDEFAIMKEHAAAGGVILANLNSKFKNYGISYFFLAAEIAYCHHEKYDGSGYPGGISGKSIPLSARIVAVADVFDALTSRRPYKDPFSLDKSIEIIRESSGSHFDPEMVEAFLEAMPEIREIYDKYKEI